jgi:predicted lactoylglutathione lyase
MINLLRCGVLNLYTIQATMKARISVLTLGVNNLERAMQFYKNLGWQTEGIVGQEYENGSAVFFDLENGIRLSLYERKNLAWDSTAALGPPSATEFAIGYMVSNSNEVDTLLKQAEKAGATITKPGQKTFWGGYAGYFQDPDGHLWEIAYMEGWETPG